MENRKSNYDITRDRVEGEFPQYDQETVIAKFHLARLPADSVIPGRKIPSGP